MFDVEAVPCPSSLCVAVGGCRCLLLWCGVAAFRWLLLCVLFGVACRCLLSSCGVALLFVVGRCRLALTIVVCCCRVWFMVGAFAIDVSRRAMLLVGVVVAMLVLC